MYGLPIHLIIEDIQNMAEASSEYLKVQYHPGSKIPDKTVEFSEGVPALHISIKPPAEPEPWAPFRSQADFEFAELVTSDHLSADSIQAHIRLHQQSPYPAISFQSLSDLDKVRTQASKLITEVALHLVAYTNTYVYFLLISLRNAPFLYQSSLLNATLLSDHCHYSKETFISFFLTCFVIPCTSQILNGYHSDILSPQEMVGCDLSVNHGLQMNSGSFGCVTFIN
jgi:hypothetical protein